MSFCAIWFMLYQIFSLFFSSNKTQQPQTTGLWIASQKKKNNGFYPPLFGFGFVKNQIPAQALLNSKNSCCHGDSGGTNIHISNYDQQYFVIKITLCDTVSGINTRKD